MSIEWNGVYPRVIHATKAQFMWSTTHLDNESDVAQKFIYPFLTENLPLGLGFPSEVVQTKKNIRRLPIGKGSDKKIYL